VSRHLRVAPRLSELVHFYDDRCHAAVIVSCRYGTDEVALTIFDLGVDVYEGIARGHGPVSNTWHRDHDCFAPLL
jgi:hypothetical protein